MPVKIPADLPGRIVLERERVPLIFEDRAVRQDIRPLQIAILNLMPDKIPTETQLLRAIGGTPLQVEVTLLRPASHVGKTTPAVHLESFYKTLEEVRDRVFDALIMTGAPIGHLAFDDVSYWPELRDFLDRAPGQFYSSFFICWGALAALHHYYGIARHYLPHKLFGVFPHRTLEPFDPLTTGFDHVFNVPVSRFTRVDRADVEARPALQILAESDESGLCLLQDTQARRVFMFNHLEYDAETLKREYERDAAAGDNPALPRNYFPGDDPQKPPPITWRAHRNLLFHNWINMVYQGTPFDLSRLCVMPPGWGQEPEGNLLT